MQTWLKLVVLIAVSTVSSVAHAGAWVPAPGRGYGKIAVRLLPGIGYFPGPDAAERGVEGPQFYGPYMEGGLQAYIELAVAPRLAVFAHVDPVRVFVLDDVLAPVRSWVNVGEPVGGVRIAFAEHPIALALEAALRVPTAGDGRVATIHRSSDGAPIGALQVGTGSVDGIFSLQGGKGFRRGYAQGGVGVELRSHGYAPVLLWNAEVGRRVGRSERNWLRVKIQGHHPLPGGTAPHHESPSGLGNGTRYVGFTLEYAVRLRERWWFELGLAGGLGPVARQGGGPVFTVGVGHDLGG